MFKFLFAVSLFCFAIPAAHCQNDTVHLLENAPQFNAKRFWPMTGATVATYTGVVVGLNQLWYADYPRSSFHFFNDWDEWLQMDKCGHSVAAYQEARFAHDFLRWSGVKENKAIWAGFAISTTLQGTLEMLDAYSAEWGFSLYDIGFNTLGGLTFSVQQQVWHEQRIMLKISAQRPKYPNVFVTSTDGTKTVNLRDRAADIYGTGPASVLLKDYNNVTYWASVSPKMFMPTSKWPAWLNIAVGYSADNLYSGKNNTWTDESGAQFVLGPEYTPGRVFLISPDIYWSKIPTRHKGLHAFFSCLDIFKMPSPTLFFVPRYRGFGFTPFLF